MKNEPHLIFPTFNDQIHIVYSTLISSKECSILINKKQSYEIFLIKKFTSENDDNSRLEKLRFQWGGGGGSQ